MPGVGNAAVMPRGPTILHSTKTRSEDPLPRDGSGESSRRLVPGARDLRRQAHLPGCCAVILIQLILGFLPAMAAEIRWSLSSNRIYVTGPGSATLSQIKAAQDQAPLEQVADGVWHLRANLIIEEGGQLVLHGTSTGGDVNELRLQSNNSGDSNRFIFISADWGSISIRDTSISSWDDAVDGPDTDSSANGRAFIG